MSFAPGHDKESVPDLRAKKEGMKDGVVVETADLHDDKEVMVSPKETGKIILSKL